MTSYPKPPDCQCQYPQVIHEDLTGHASDCPTRARIHSGLAIKAGLPEGTRFNRGVLLNTSADACRLTVGASAGNWFEGVAVASENGCVFTIPIQG